MELRVLLFLSALTIMVSCSPSSNADRERQAEVLNSAIQMGDQQTAITALHNLIALEPDEKAWRDSLALTYFRARQYEQAFAACRVSMASAQKQQSEQLLRVAAESSKVLGLHDESLKLHLRLLEFSPKDPVLLYDIGLLYFSLLQLEVGIQYMDRVASAPEAEKQTLAVKAGADEQLVSYKAAALNAKGYGLTELKRPTEAEEALNAALALQPDFANAKANLYYLKGQQGR